MRLGELLSLEWKRIDFDARVAFLPTTKNGEPRSVALSSAAVTALKEMDNPRRSDGRVFNWVKSDSFVGHFIRCVARALALYDADCVANDEKPAAEFLTDLRFHELPRGGKPAVRKGPQPDGGGQHDWPQEIHARGSREGGGEAGIAMRLPFQPREAHRDWSTDRDAIAARRPSQRGTPRFA